MRKVASILVFGLLFAFAPLQLSHAASNKFKTVDDAPPQQIVGGMAHKLVRGLANVTTGIGEIPRQIYLTTQKEGGAMGSTVGPLKGIGMTFVRSITGVVEVLTFFYPLPGFYAPYMDPEFVWEKE